MEKLFFISLIGTCISCGNSLEVKVYNKTGADVDSFGIADKYIGRLKKDEVIEITDCKAMEMQDGGPFGMVEGRIGDRMQNISKDAWFCGTGLETVTKGDFEFDLEKAERGEGYIY